MNRVPRRHARAAMPHIALRLAGCALLAACASSTAPDTPGVPVVGTWRYAGRQTTPADADLAGTLVFSTQAGARIGGALDFIETNATGAQRRIAGAAAGRTVDSTTLDFDVTLSGVTRRHVGVVKGDSVTGTWIEQPIGGGAPSAAGSFRGARQR